VGKRQGKGTGRWLGCKKFVHAYVNAKLIPVETILGIGERGIRESGGGCEFKYDIFDSLLELLQMPQCTLTQHKKGKKKKERERCWIRVY
jgi:ssDNA-binding Zn-finger/Zn-ribbon topoisomerase 1